MTPDSAGRSECEESLRGAGGALGGGAVAFAAVHVPSCAAAGGGGGGGGGVGSGAGAGGGAGSSQRLSRVMAW
eukprot:1006887-Alexandrium_andersonii.AAC.1